MPSRFWTSTHCPEVHWKMSSICRCSLWWTSGSCLLLESGKMLLLKPVPWGRQAVSQPSELTSQEAPEQGFPSDGLQFLCLETCGHWPFLTLCQPTSCPGSQRVTQWRGRMKVRCIRTAGRGDRNPAMEGSTSGSHSDLRQALHQGAIRTIVSAQWGLGMACCCNIP